MQNVRKHHEVGAAVCLWQALAVEKSQIDPAVVDELYVVCANGAQRILLPSDGTDRPVARADVDERVVFEVVQRGEHRPHSRHSPEVAHPVLLRLSNEAAHALCSVARRARRPVVAREQR
eukprot:5208474-Prymnesium_polylepis.2